MAQHNSQVRPRQSAVLTRKHSTIGRTKKGEKERQRDARRLGEGTAESLLFSQCSARLGERFPSVPSSLAVNHSSATGARASRVLSGRFCWICRRSEWSIQGYHVTGRQENQGSREARHSFDQTSKIISTNQYTARRQLPLAQIVSASACDTVDKWLLDFQHLV